jgi:formimidoylglutamate deiminase
MPAFMQQSGQIAIGSDSHIEINPAAELKMLEYAQRLVLQKRNVCCEFTQPHVATWLWLQSVAGGVQISAQPVAGIQPGQKAGVISLQCEANLSYANMLDSFVFSDTVNAQPIDL